MRALLYCGASYLLTIANSIAAAPCGCGDRLDIESRLSQIKVAQDQYRLEIGGVEAEEKRSGQTIMTTWDNYKEGVQPRVNAAMAKARREGARTFAAETSGWDCSISVDPKATACLSPALRKHEERHQESCRKIGTLISWTYSLRLADLAREEIDAYEHEAAFLRGQLAALDKDCPKDKPPAAAPVSVSAVKPDEERPPEDPDRWAMVKKWRVSVSAEIRGSGKYTIIDRGGALEREEEASFSRMLAFQRFLEGNFAGQFQSRKEVEDYARQLYETQEDICRRKLAGCTDDVRQSMANYQKGQAFPPPLVSPGEGSVQAFMEGYDKRRYDLSPGSGCGMEYRIDDRHRDLITDVVGAEIRNKTWHGKGRLDGAGAKCTGRMWLDLGKGTYSFYTNGPDTGLPVRYAYNKDVTDIRMGFGVTNFGAVDGKLPRNGMVLEGSVTMVATGPRNGGQAPMGALVNQIELPNLPFMKKPTEVTIRWRLEPAEMDERRTPPRIPSVAETSAGEGQVDPNWPLPLYTKRGDTVSPAPAELIAEIERHAEAGPGTPQFKGYQCLETGMEAMRMNLHQPAFAHLKKVDGARAVSCALRAWCEGRVKLDLASLSEPLISRYIGAPAACAGNDAYRSPAKVVADNGALFKEVSQAIGE